MEKAIFLMDYLNISQKANGEFSHKGDKALDLSGKDTKVDSLKAPFTGTIKKIYESSNAVWLESNEKVKYADGTVDYMTILTMHDNDVSNLYVGKVIKQGEIYFEEGTKGYATGNHIHLSVGKGKFTGTGWYKNSYGNWCINNQYDVHKALFLSDKTIIKNSGNYNWIRTNSLMEETDNFIRYKVIKGDNLTTISRKYNTTIEKLVELNNIKNKDLIYIDQVLIIPNNLTYFKKYLGSTNSIVDALKKIGEDSKYEYRNKVASVNNIKNYMGTAIQNKALLNLLKEGKLIKP